MFALMDRSVDVNYCHINGYILWTFSIGRYNMKVAIINGCSIEPPVYTVDVFCVEEVLSSFLPKKPMFLISPLPF